MIAPDRDNGGTPLFAFAGGGTGGHIYPALAIAEALRKRFLECRFLFFCTQRRVDERILDRPDFEVVRQPLHNLPRLPWRWPAFGRGWLASASLCRRRFANQAPAFVLGTGGLASIPAILEANRSGIPTAILNPDAKPGRANRFLAGRVRVVFAQWDATLDYVVAPGLLVVSGCPIRAAFRNATREAGLGAFGLSSQRKTLLVTGASQGAKSINDALIAVSGQLAAERTWQVLHLTGDADEQRVRRAYEAANVAARVLPFTHRMAEALAAADLVISRAGASTLAEITAMGRPSILLPYPYHRDGHQLENARCLARASAAQILLDAISPERNGPALWSALRPYLWDDAARARMAVAAARLGRLDADEAIADRLLQLGCLEGRRETVQTDRSASR